jgi:hypothetical protein
MTAIIDPLLDLGVGSADVKLSGNLLELQSGCAPSFNLFG